MTAFLAVPKFRRLKECCRFDRTKSQKVVMGNVLATLFERTSTFSFALWFKSTPNAAFPKRQIFTKTDPTGSVYTGFDFSIVTAGRLTMRMDNTLFVNGRLKEWTGDVSDGTWRHVVFTQTAAGTAAAWTCYMNGAAMAVFGAVDAGALGAPTTVTTAPLQISGDPTLFYFTGKIDEVGVYNKTLSAAEASTVYNAGVVKDLTTYGPSGNLVGYWRLGEGASYPTIPDDSTNNNSGTMTNMARADITNR